MFAVWRLGAVYCPLNYNLTGMLLAHPLRELRARLLVTGESRVATLDGIGGEPALPRCVVHRPRRDHHDWERLAAGTSPRGASAIVDLDDLLGSSPVARAPQRPTDTAAILQTSGTTGPSKGVVLSHRWINQYTFVPRQLVDQGDVIHNDLPLYHGAGAMTNVVRAAWAGCEVALWVLRGDQPIRRGLMGRPTAFLEAAILGPDDRPLPPEHRGELAFRGRLPSLLLDAYLGRPQATAEVMRGGWLHTGDAAIRDEAGLYYYLDRMGSFIRSKGENISSFEVEELINAHPAVAMSAAVGVPALEGLEEDVAVFAVPRPGASLSAAELGAWCAEAMPRYLRPRHLRIVSDLPRGATNKVEKYRLREALLRELEPSRRDER
jgi:acyl-CoA synthetase (AMP-forming)/AMP-acid ligase II